ncbi:MAG: InlB B-repeat-containing protein [Coriobacteriales bacterium]|jgi:uncharacterized repeat protein (TIGR02543 family)|nr:InlB B-repeat-containing protein [Coriobacteriales bacterium]
MEHARTAPHKAALRKALACLLAAALALSLGGAHTAYGEEGGVHAGDGAAPAGGTGLGTGEDAASTAEVELGVGGDAASASAAEQADEAEPGVREDAEGDGAQGAAPEDVQEAKVDAEQDAGPNIERSAEAGIGQSIGSDDAQGSAPDAESPAVSPAEAGEEPGGLAPLASHTIDVSAGVASGTGYTWDAATKVVTFTAGAKGSAYTLIQTGKQNVLGIVVASGVSTTITLKNLSLATELPCIKLEGTANLALSLEGTSVLESSKGAGIEVTQSAALTIQGKGELTASGGWNSGAAGIGGSKGGTNGTVTISGGTLTANGSCAGIGGGEGGSGGTVTINGGAVTASGGRNDGAGIGGGRNGSGGTVTINGGAVTASGSDGGAGIGSGGGGAGAVSINGGTVTANGGFWGSGIGGGSHESGGTIVIKNGAVTANGGWSGSGIGGGDSAIDAYWGNAGTGHYVSAYLDSASYDRTLAYYAGGSAARTGSFTLYADYSSFAYTTGSAATGTHRIFAWQASPLAYLGRAERVYDSSPDIASTLSAAPVALKLNASAAARPPDWQYTVKFDANGGKVGKAASASLKRAKGAALGALPAPVRTGHTFLGWYTGKTGGTRVTAATKVSGDATCYAHWKKGVYVVSLDANGGRLPAKAAHSVRRTYGTAIGKLPAPVRTNCTFLGWYTAKSKGTKVTTRTRATRSVTLYARWKANGPVVTLDANGGKVGKSARASLVRTKGAAIGKLATPKRTGYTFRGWFTGKAKGTRVTAATKATRSVILYAHWKAKAHTVKLDANGGKLGKSATSSLKKSHNSKFGRLATPKRTGHRFDGWYTAKRGGTKVTASTRVTRAVTLYAHWKRAR